MKVYWGSEAVAPGTHWLGGWVGPRADLDAAVERKIPSPDHLACIPALYH